MFTANFTQRYMRGLLRTLTYVNVFYNFRFARLKVEGDIPR